MKDIFLEWNPWWTDNYTFAEVERDVFYNVLPWIERREIISILGVRRSGKTTLMYEIISYLLNKKKIPPENIFFIKGDDDRVDKHAFIDTALDNYYTWHNLKKSQVYVFIDEVQDIDKWQKTLKRIYDLKKNVKIFISGSNASVMKENLSTMLAGRCAYFEVFPFSFKEFLRSKKINIDGERNILKNKNQLRHLLLDYISNGSFPEVVLEKNLNIKKKLVGFYFDSIFYRDIIKRKDIRNPAKLETLVKLYLQNISNLTNFTKAGKYVELTTDSVVEYTRALEDAYLIFSVRLFAFSYKKQVINPKKIYCVDTGIRNSLGFKFSEDTGRLYENIVFTHLRRKTKNIFYWKGKNECDFIVKDNKELKAIQVCYNIQNSHEREVKGLLEAMDQFNIKEGIIITENESYKETVDGKRIVFVPLWKWLLAP